MKIENFVLFVDWWLHAQTPPIINIDAVKRFMFFNLYALMSGQTFHVCLDWKWTDFDFYGIIWTLLCWLIILGLN